MRINIVLLKSFWVEAINITIYLVKRPPSTAINLKIPQEVWSRRLVNYFDLKIFGCPAYAHVSDDKGKKVYISMVCTRSEEIQTAVYQKRQVPP